MSYDNIIKNINRLLLEKEWKVSDLEYKIESGGSKSPVANILRGSSKNPTVESLQLIAKALSVEIQDLLDDDVKHTSTNTALLLDSCKIVINQIDEMSLSNKLNYKKIIAIIKEVYEYSAHLDLKSIEENFVKWTIHKHIS